MLPDKYLIYICITNNINLFTQRLSLKMDNLNASRERERESGLSIYTRTKRGQKNRERGKKECDPMAPPLTRKCNAIGFTAGN